ncbi:heat shock protein 75 kDa, mitochondrial-like [Daphnia carinata]|uniref:heat shock protein 75 kDa, mitochondrial-like n=1 Tax=Daphnia carinata TaxID=120202 RepID=UPI002580EC12|nr:heat shock protein 75 kDa, mitochondrial-like [Daphnia carinata]
MAASMRLSRAVTLLLRRADNFRRIPQSSTSTLLLKNPALNTDQYLNRFVSTTSLVRNEQQSNAKTAPEKREFQAETRMLLDIVAKSLYSEKEVFVRELISNASDALEKFRYLSLTGTALENSQRPLEIKITAEKEAKTLTIEDSGIGMNKEEIINNLGTIARSGSKAYIEQLKSKGGAPDSVSNIIGQFGVGFYSAFMVAEKVDVFTKSSLPGSVGLHWSSDGTGTYELSEDETAKLGTKIIIHLKSDCTNFSQEDTIKDIIQRYSNFVGSPVSVNGTVVNTVQPLWLMDPKEVTAVQHDEFYRFISDSYDRPRFVLHYKTDVPLNVRALIYFPEGKPGLFEMSRESDAGLALYCRRVLIKNKAENLLPKWLRFCKGVVDSEDIPLNLSRELLQEGALIRKLRTVLTNRILRFLHDKSQKAKDEYERFYRDYGIFLKEGILSSNEQLEKEEISKLLRYESSQLAPGEKVSIAEYCNRMRPGQRDIYYLAAPSRELAESSAYFEALKKRDVEVLFCFEPYDELVLLQLREFDRKHLTSVEKEMRQESAADQSTDSETGTTGLDSKATEDLITWLSATLSGRAAKVKVTRKLESHPCVVTVEEMGAARHFVRTQSQSVPEEQRYKLLQPQLEINPKHPIITKMHKLKDENPGLATLLANQLFANAMVSAGLLDDARPVVANMNELLTLALEKC